MCVSTYEVEESDVGEQVQCQCGEVFVVEAPAALVGSESAASANEQWFVQAANGTQSGPISKTELNAKVNRGEIDLETQLLREGDAQWQWADAVYPQLAPAPVSTTTSSQAKTSSASRSAKSSKSSRSQNGDRRRSQLDGTVGKSLIHLLLNPCGVAEVADDLDEQSTLSVGAILVAIWAAAMMSVFIIEIEMPPGWFKAVSKGMLVLSVGSTGVLGCCLAVRVFFGQGGGLHTDIAALGAAMAHCGLATLAAVVFHQALSSSLPKTTMWVVCGGLLFSALLVSAIVLFCGITRCADVPDRPAAFSLSVTFLLCAYVMYLTADFLQTLPPLRRF